MGIMCVRNHARRKDVLGGRRHLMQMSKWKDRGKKVVFLAIHARGNNRRRP